MVVDVIVVVAVEVRMIISIVPVGTVHTAQ